MGDAPRIQVITPRTDAEWPFNHPLRRVSKVVSHTAADAADVLICTLAGEERQPPAADDHDVDGRCSTCGKPIVFRASAPKAPRRICWRCWLGDRAP